MSIVLFSPPRSPSPPPIPCIFFFFPRLPNPSFSWTEWFSPLFFFFHHIGVIFAFFSFLFFLSFFSPSQDIVAWSVFFFKKPTNPPPLLLFLSLFLATSLYQCGSPLFSFSPFCPLKDKDFLIHFSMDWYFPFFIAFHTIVLFIIPSRIVTAFFSPLQ